MSGFKRVTLIVITLTALTLAGCSKSEKTSEGAAVTVDGITCAPTNAVGHEPVNVATPTKVLTEFPKQFMLVTNCGNIVITTVGDKAPFTMTSLSALAKGGFYDDTLCHRLTTQGLFVLQCGDPTATGSGGPQFTYPDENLPENVPNNYPEGSVAMANSGPNTNGSQFFLVYANTTLAPSYTLWGTITSGLDIVKAIAKAGATDGAPDGVPAKTISITKVLVS
jgi:peptidyl-prolyl cis-trans isomerase B (cyclophilin B)